MSEHRRIAIIGAGPSGYTAGVYAGRARLEPILFAGVKSGGQLMFTTEVENYPGFPEGINGPELMFSMRQQAERFGTTMKDEYVVAVDLSQRPFRLWTQSQAEANFPSQEFERMSPDQVAGFRQQLMQQEPAVTADAVIIATGARSRMLGVPGEEGLLGKGVSTCAVCDAAFFKEKKTFVVGGGDSAMEDALALTKFAASVTIVHRREEFRASKIMQERVLNHPKISVMWNSAVTEVIGTDKVTQLKIKENDQEKVVDADGIFLAIGHIPSTQLFQNQIKLDQQGFIAARHSFSQAGLELAQGAVSEEGVVKFPSMTSVEGVFAAGDVVDIRYWQAITAAGQGCMAAIDAERWLESQPLSE